jgi:SMI1 / KNR4 family (SUKH-1)
MLNALLILLGCFALFVVLPVLILVVRDRIRQRLRRQTPSQRDARLKAWCQRIFHPKADEVEASCGGMLPKRLLAMYVQPDSLLDSNFQVCAPTKDPAKESWWIGDFIPLSAEDQKWTCDLSEFGKGFCFAGDGMGNFYWVPVDVERRDDAPVYFACHDPWGNEKVCDSLDEFLSWPRVSKAK